MCIRIGNVAVCLTLSHRFRLEISRRISCKNYQWLNRSMKYTAVQPFIGVYALFRPTLIIRDANLIRTMLIKDFQHFMDRGVYCDEENDPLSGHLFAIEAEKWKYLRSKLTPAFSSGKMRAIFSTLLDCKHPLQNIFRTQLKPIKVLKPAK